MRLGICGLFGANLVTLCRGEIEKGKNILRVLTWAPGRRVVKTERERFGQRG